MESLNIILKKLKWSKIVFECPLLVFPHLRNQSPFNTRYTTLIYNPVTKFISFVLYSLHLFTGAPLAYAILKLGLAFAPRKNKI